LGTTKIDIRCDFRKIRWYQSTAGRTSKGLGRVGRKEGWIRRTERLPAADNPAVPPWRASLFLWGVARCDLFQKYRVQAKNSG